MKPEQRIFFLKVGVIAMLGLAALDYIVLPPIQSFWDGQSERIEALNKKVRTGEQLLSREDAIRNQWAGMLRANLPADVSAAENRVYTAIGRWARTGQVTFTSLTPQWRPPDDGYRTLECRIAANGDQAQIGRFIYEMEMDPLPVNLEECELTTRDAHGSELTLTARFSFLQLQEKGGAQ